MIFVRENDYFRYEYFGKNNERKYKRENIAYIMLSLEEVNCFADDCRELTIITKRGRIDEI